MDERLLMEGSFPQVLLFFVSYIGETNNSIKGNPRATPQIAISPPPKKKREQNKASLRDYRLDY